MKVRFSWFNSLIVRTKSVSRVKSIYSPKLKGLLYKRLDRDEMNAIGRQLYATIKIN